MKLPRPGLHRSLGLILALTLVITSSLAADDHVVPIGELHQRSLSASRARQTDVAKVEGFLALEPVQQTLRTAKLDSASVERAVALLSDDELARLAARTDKARADLRGGALTNQEITYILIALGTAVLILVIVAAR